MAFGKLTSRSASAVAVNDDVDDIITESVEAE
jgi:hypothetical protein